MQRAESHAKMFLTLVFEEKEGRRERVGEGQRVERQVGSVHHSVSIR